MSTAASGRFNGQKLRQLRTDRGWSQAEVGRRIGAHVTSISDWERGANAPSGRHVVALAREFSVSAEVFYGDADAGVGEALPTPDAAAMLDALRPMARLIVPLLREELERV